MSILIKGMGMPHCEVLTIRISPNGEVHYIGEACQSARRAEAVEIPPHGRLIDADALDKRIEEGGCCCTEEYAEWMGECIDNAPTIIEAEEETWTVR